MGNERFSVSAPTRHKLTVEEFEALDAAGCFHDKGRFELIEGEIYQMSPLHRPHARAVLEIGAQFMRAIEDAGLSLEVLSPVSLRLGRHSLPEPDIMVALHDPIDRYVEFEHARLVLEIAGTSQRHDLKRKASLYSRHGVPEYWVVDLKDAQIHQMTGPTPRGYADVEVHPFGARVVSKTVGDIALDSARLA